MATIVSNKEFNKELASHCTEWVSAVLAVKTETGVKAVECVEYQGGLVRLRSTKEDQTTPPPIVKKSDVVAIWTGDKKPARFNTKNKNWIVRAEESNAVAPDATDFKTLLNALKVGSWIQVSHIKGCNAVYALSKNAVVCIDSNGQCLESSRQSITAIWKGKSAPKSTKPSKNWIYRATPESASEVEKEKKIKNKARITELEQRVSSLEAEVTALRKIVIDMHDELGADVQKVA